MYGKIYPSLYTGSLYGKGAMVLALWPYIIAHARIDENSTVELNPALLANVFGEPVDSITKAIDFFCQPDPESRTTEEQGRRLIKAGTFLYRVVNLQKYRDNETDDARRLFWRDKKRRQRGKVTPQVTPQVTITSAPSQGDIFSVSRVDNGHLRKMSPSVPGDVPHADADADADALPPLSSREGPGERGGCEEFSSNGVEAVRPDIPSTLFHITNALRGRINQFYSRPITEHWSAEEEHVLAIVARRPACLDELAKIQLLRKPPQSVLTLLNRWGSHVDRTRKPQKEFDCSPHIQLKAVEALIAGHPARPDSPYNRNKLTQQQKDEFTALRQKRQTLLTTISAV